ncbi:MAG: nitrile hydratase subunit beta [Pseudomonadota bacterium]
MNGIHDMGGFTNFGPVRPEAREPVFHDEWERRIFAMNFVGLAFVGPVDRVRHSIERMDALEYLKTSYYEHWLHCLEALTQELGYVTAQELTAGRVLRDSVLPHAAPDAVMAEGLARGGMPSSRSIGVDSIFAVGQQVRARNVEIDGHTRLPRYVRGKVGTIAALHGCHVFPDTFAHDLGENPQPLYTVRFEARELWGDNVTRRDCVYIDLWESYLQTHAAGLQS